ncbi:thioredoxin-disulfide reductase [Candidatus Uhrbacteria bacterium]|nr:thioredoxin-disulfide reductase [Candidatus Uhrbacteria bacterium]
MRSVAIIGSGPAGWTAAIYAARASLNPILFEGSEPGGQLMTTTEVENFPGFIHGIQGPELMQVLREQAKRFGTEIVSAMVESLKQVEGGFELVSNGQTYLAQTVILSTGATAKRLGLDSEKRLYGRGVSACATCDGFFFRGKNVIVVGGGDSAMEESSFLTRFAEKVYLVHRRDSFRASKIMQDRVKANPKIEIILNSEVADIIGEEKVTAALLKNIVTGETREMPIDGVFAAIGHAPNVSLVQGLVDLDEKGYVVTLPGSTRTNIPGLFACGDVQDAKYRQAITAAGTGCMAALDAEKYLSDG